MASSVLDDTTTEYHRLIESYNYIWLWATPPAFCQMFAHAFVGFLVRCLFAEFSETKFVYAKAACRTDCLSENSVFMIRDQMKTEFPFQSGLSAVFLCGCASHQQLALQRDKDINHRYFEELGNHGATKA